MANLCSAINYSIHLYQQWGAEGGGGSSSCWICWSGVLAPPLPSSPTQQTQLASCVHSPSQKYLGRWEMASVSDLDPDPWA